MTDRTKTFFIIEDHTVTNIGLYQLLKRELGIECCGSAFSKSEAEEKLRELAQRSSQPAEEKKSMPDIIILDLYLGEESGLDLLREICADYKDVKVLVYSMYAKPGILALALEDGAHGFVEKSAPEDVLIDAVKRILAGETFVQQNLISPLFTYKTIFDGLTRQEQKILKRLFNRKTKAQISDELNIVPRTVENYLSRIFDKTGCQSIDEIIEKFAR